jgi:hypothetical protein
MTEVPTQIEDLVQGMRDAIDDFEHQRLNIDRLAWELKSRIAALREVADEAWVDELKAIWNQLEVINAFFVESDRKSLTDDERRDAEEVLGELWAALVAY